MPKVVELKTKNPYAPPPEVQKEMAVHGLLSEMTEFERKYGKEALRDEVIDQVLGYWDELYPGFRSS